MLVRSPCELYIKYLLVHPDKFSNKAVQVFLDQNRLDYLGDSYLNQLRAQLVRPERFRPRDPYDEESQNFLKEHDLQDLFFPDADMDIAFEILASPKAKCLIEGMCEHSAPHHQIAKLFHDCYIHRGCTTRAVTKYFKCFWNLDLMDRTDLCVILDLRIKAYERSEDPFIRDAAPLYKRHSYNDSRRMAARMPNTAFSAMLTQRQEGLSPAEFDMADALLRCRILTMCRINEVLAAWPKGADIVMRNLTISLKTLQEIEDSIARPQEELRKQLATVKGAHDEKRTPTINEISGGRHTGDLMALPAHEEESDEPKRKK